MTDKVSKMELEGKAGTIIADADSGNIFAWKNDGTGMNINMSDNAIMFYDGEHLNSFPSIAIGENGIQARNSEGEVVIISPDRLYELAALLNNKKLKKMLE